MNPKQKKPLPLNDLIIVGGGAAGLMAAISAADYVSKITLFDSMHKPALKIGITGKGKGNITNSSNLKDFLSHFNEDGRFLKYAFNRFFNTELIEFFNSQGLKTISERGNRIFPVSGKATDVSRCLINCAKSKGVNILVSRTIKDIIVEDSICKGVLDDLGNKIFSKAVIIATGGITYPLTGSTGIGHKIAQKHGHKIIKLLPSLVELATNPPLNASLNKLLLKNISLELRHDDKKVTTEFGEMSFINGYLSGATVLKLSRTAVKMIDNQDNIELWLDLKPALSHTQLDERLIREIKASPKAPLQALIKKLLPSQMVQLFIDTIGIPPQTLASNLNALQRKAIKNWLKKIVFKITSYAPIKTAIVTSGGVSTKEIDSTTMQSKLISNLYFAGEVIDIDADTGGFNLQAAFSTGWLAGKSATKP